jgi:hypothetical protein
MSHRVFWSPNAERRLEEMLVSAADADQLASVAKQIDQRLVENTSAFGESRYDNVRVAFVRPLGVQFEVLEDVRTVIVFDIWKIKRRR